MHHHHHHCHPLHWLLVVCPGPGPMLVFDASTGRVLLSQHMLRVLQSSPVHTLSTATRATSGAAQRMLQLLAGQVGQPECWSGRTLQGRGN